METLEVLLYLAAGGLLGTAYFVLLFRAVSLHTAQAPVVQILPLYLLRFAAAGAAFWALAQQGALPLLTALLGFLLARVAVQRWKGAP